MSPEFRVAVSADHPPQLSIFGDDYLHAQDPTRVADRKRSELLDNARRCRCGSASELRRCRANNGVAFQCRSCLRQLGRWIPHRDLIGIDVHKLPEWVKR
jgi:hypothetical protein